MVIIGDDNTWILCFVLSCGLITSTHSWAHIAVDILSGVSIVFTCCAVEHFLLLSVRSKEKNKSNSTFLKACPLNKS